MEIKEFIKDVILQLADGLQDVIQEQDSHNIIVNPNVVVGTMACGRYIPNNLNSYKNLGRPVQFLQLDMALQVAEGSTLGAGGSARIAIFSGKVSGETSDRNSSESKISIAIPLCLPITDVTQKK